MNRGGYIFMLMFIGVFFMFQTYQNNKMLDRYENIIELKVSAEKQDTVKNEVLSLKNEINTIAQELSKKELKHDTIINNSYVRNIYVKKDPNILSDKDDNKILYDNELITKKE